MANEAEALLAHPSASELATRVCHEEQMVVWSGEVIEALSMIDFLREDWSYEDTLRANATVANCIRSIVESAFGHPELKPDLIHRSALAEDTARAAEGWQPIETAPRDGTDILLFHGSRPPVVAGWFDEPETDVPGWYDFDDPERPLYVVPTHWRALPAPPALPLTKEAADANR